MREILLCKYGEIVLKGANKRYFEDTLCKELRRRAKKCGNFDISRAQSTIYIEPKDDFADIDAMFEAASKTFGLAAIGRAAVCEKDLDDIKRVAREYIPQFLFGKKSFKVEGKRSDKTFPLNSMELAGEIGAEILEATGGKIRVDVRNPEITVKVEIRERAAYVHAGQFKGAGGIPVGTGGHGMLLLSGGIDSPVAGYMMAKRGLRVEAVHFESIPYTSELAKDKVVRLARTIAAYTGDVYIHVVSLTKIQEELVKHCEEDYFTLLLRRYMMYIASKIAADHESKCLITGESLGQVASQTMEAIAVTDNAASIPVLRPCIGMDKEEIVEISRKIGTFDISIEPYEDCCTVFTPKHPKTKPQLDKVLVEERKLDFEALAKEAIDGAYVIKAEAYQ
ncbi:MAG: tRNA 4-thiouridine(8) synthase ThiI [Ruminococcaceae bacterium]|nr:tRNA 4-thiouridine(8) synthase ThiI [Oscillospiraceae bacterium]